MLRKSAMFDNMVEVEEFKRGLPEHHLSVWKL